MINREKLGVVASEWPTLSVPDPVQNTYERLVAHLPSDIQAHEIGRGYHNAGWGYTEIEVRATTWSRAYDEAERIDMECSIALQLGVD